MGTLFDDRQFLHGLPVRGQKIKYVKPTKFAFHSNVIADEKNLLELEKEYTVRRVELNSSSTYVFLEEFWIEGLDEYRNNQKCFNMHAFSWEKPPIDLSRLIGRDPRDCAPIHNSYGYGVSTNGKIRYEGDPMLYVEYDEESYEITKVELK
jgi:hypothetical protein